MEMVIREVNSGNIILHVEVTILRAEGSSEDIELVIYIED